MTTYTDASRHINMETHPCIMYDGGVMRFRYINGVTPHTVMAFVNYWRIKLQAEFPVQKVIQNEHGTHLFYAREGRTIDVIA